VRGLGYSPLYVGILLGIFEGAGLAGPFVFGAIADKTRAYRALIIASYVLTIAAVIPLAVFVSPLLSAALIAVFGFAYRSTTPLFDAALTLKLGREGNYGLPRGMGSLGFIAMSLFLQWTPFLKPDTTRNLVFWMVTTTGTAAFLAVFIPRLPAKEEDAPVTEAAPLRNGLTAGKFTFVTPFFAGGILMMFLCRLAMSPVYTFFPLYLTEELHWNAVSGLFALATANEVYMMIISKKLINRFGPLPLLAVSALGIAARLFIYAAFPFKGWIIAAAFLHSLCFGVFHTSAVAFITQTVPPESRGVGMSMYLSLGSGFPALVGNVLGGILLDRFGKDSLRSGYPMLFTVFGCIALLAAAVWFVFMRGKRAEASLRNERA
jgi:PPP family 3-phenylpropionic acid transporter